MDFWGKFWSNLAHRTILHPHPLSAAQSHYSVLLWLHVICVSVELCNVWMFISSDNTVKSESSSTSDSTNQDTGELWDGSVLYNSRIMNARGWDKKHYYNERMSLVDGEIPRGSLESSHQWVKKPVINTHWTNPLPVAFLILTHSLSLFLALFSISIKKYDEIICSIAKASVQITKKDRKSCQ